MLSTLSTRLSSEEILSLDAKKLAADGSSLSKERPLPSPGSFAPGS